MTYELFVSEIMVYELPVRVNVIYELTMIVIVIYVVFWVSFNKKREKNKESFDNLPCVVTKTHSKGTVFPVCHSVGHTTEGLSFSSPWAATGIRKNFVVCPIKGTPQRGSLPANGRRVSHTAMALPCVFQLVQCVIDTRQRAWLPQCAGRYWPTCNGLVSYGFILSICFVVCGSQILKDIQH